MISFISFPLCDVTFFTTVFTKYTFCNADNPSCVQYQMYSDQSGHQNGGTVMDKYPCCLGKAKVFLISFAGHSLRYHKVHEESRECNYDKEQRENNVDKIISPGFVHCNPTVTYI